MCGGTDNAFGSVTTVHQPGAVVTQRFLEGPPRPGRIGHPLGAQAGAAGDGGEVDLPVVGLMVGQAVEQHHQLDRASVRSC